VPVREAVVGGDPRRRFTLAIVTGTGALIVLGVTPVIGDIHSRSLHEKLGAIAGAIGFLVLAAIAVGSIASSLSRIVSRRAGGSGGTAVSLITSFVGYATAVFVALGLLAVPVQHLLLGGALTGVVVGIAAQQALGNVFAGLVLLFARPFAVDERVRIHSGALGGTFDGVIRGITLAYVTIDTVDGCINIPNSTILLAGVGPAPPGEPMAPPKPLVTGPVAGVPADSRGGIHQRDTAIPTRQGTA